MTSKISKLVGKVGLVFFMVLAMTGWISLASALAADPNWGSIPVPPSKVVANPGHDKTTYTGFKVTLNGSKSLTAQGSSLTYSWSFISKPAGSQSVLVNGNTVNPYFITDVAGDYILSLTVNDSLGNSDVRQVAVKAKNFNDTADDENMLLNFTQNSLAGYTFKDLVPLTDGWVIIGETSKNQIIILNTLTGEAAKTYQLPATPTRIDFNFDTGMIVATQSPTNRIATIDVNTDSINYITPSSNTVSGGNNDVTIGKDNIVFFLSYNWPNTWIGIMDTALNAEVGHTSINSEQFNLIVFDKNNNNLILGECGTSPSSLARCTYDEQNHSLTLVQNVWGVGGNGQELSISADGKHIAFCCGGGNGDGYSIWDIDSTNLTNTYGEWNTGAYPTSAAFSYDNKYLIANNRTNVQRFDVNTHVLINNIGPTSSSNISKVGISRGGKIGYAYISGSLCSFRIGETSILPLAISSISTDKTSPQIEATDISLTANISGGMNKNYYHFWVYDGSNWALEQSYSASSTFNWKPQAAGNYYLLVEAKDINSSSDYDAYNYIPFNITKRMSTIATLSDLMIDGKTVAGFNPTTLTYNVELASGTTVVPTVTATVTDSGKANAVVTAATSLPGTTTVLVTAEDGTTTKTYTINFTVAAPVVKQPVTLIIVTGCNGAVTVPLGGTLQMNAQVFPDNASNKEVLWSIKNGTGRGTISMSGLLTGTVYGTVTITATAKDGSGVKGAAKIKVIVPVTSIAVAGANNATTVEVSHALQMKATVQPWYATDSSVTWSVMNGTGSATINSSGLLTGNTAGTVTIVATANDGTGLSGSQLINVIEPPSNKLVSTITVSGKDDAITVKLLGSLQMNASILPIDATNQKVKWSVVSGTGRAMISTTGLLVGTRTGTVTVKAAANDGSGVVGSLEISVIGR